MITPAKVHHAIQEIDNKLPDYGSISIFEIAGCLHVSDNDVLAYINTLHDLYYLKFTDHTNKNIKLTFSGRHTIAPL